MRVFVFDLDDSLTVLPTNIPKGAGDNGKNFAPIQVRKNAYIKAGKTHEAFIRDLMKPGIAELFHCIWKTGDVVAIPTFSNNPPLVRELLLGTGLKPEQCDRIKIRYRPANFVNGETEKTELFVSIFDEIGYENIDEVIYVEDTTRHIDEMTKLMAEILPNVPLKVIQVSRDPADIAFIHELIDYARYKNPFEALLTCNNEEMICRFINEKNADSRDEAGIPLLHYAARLGYAKVVQKLMECHASVYATTRAGRTALHEAAAYGHLKVAAILLNSGAKLLANDEAGNLPLDLATTNEHAQTARFLHKTVQASMFVGSFWAHEKAQADDDIRKTVFAGLRGMSL